MSDASDLQARVEALERAMTDRSVAESRRRGSAVKTLWAVLAAAFLIANLWLAFGYAKLSAQRSQERLFWIVCQTGSTPAERVRAFLELAADGNTEWRSAKLRKLDLAGIELPGVQLSFADLEASKLSEADLSGANLYRSGLRFADLSGAKLTKAACVEADLFKADLRGADFKQADLRGCSMEQAQAANAVFWLTNLSGAYLPMCDLSGADLTLAELHEADLLLANLTGANLFRTKLAGANLDQANLTDARWWRAEGLSPELIRQFQEKFPPTENTNPRWREDYGKWLAQRNQSTSIPKETE